VIRRRRLTALLLLAGFALVIVLAVRAVSGSSPKPPRPAAGPTPTTPGPAVSGTGVSATGGSGVPVDAAAFAPGSCVSFPPTSGDRHLTVFLDAGHGGVDPGAVGTTEAGQTIEEANLTLPVEMDAAAILRAAGFRVVVSRTTGGSVARLGAGDIDNGVYTVQGSHDDVAARPVCANEAHANILVGIYFDSGAPNNAGCVTGWDAVRPFSADNLRLADLVQGEVLAAMNAHGWNIPDEGVKSDDQLGSAVSSQAAAYGHLLLLGPAESGYFTTPSEMPGALIEPLFITDPFEGTIAAGSLGQHVIATGLADAVERYFAPPPAASSPD